MDNQSASSDVMMNSTLPQSKPNNNKKLLIIGGVIIVLLLVVWLAVALITKSPTGVAKQVAQNVSPTPNVSNGPSVVPNYNPNNPLISKQEAQRQADSYQKMYQQAGEKAPSLSTPVFKVVLPAKYLNNSSSMNLVPQAYASTTTDCSGALSGPVNVYVLKNDIGTTDATPYASAFGLSVNAGSVPMGDGSSFYYQYTNDYTSFLNVAQPSVEMHFHLAPSATPAAIMTSITQTEAQTQAYKDLGTFITNLEPKAVFDSGVTILSGGEYVTTFTKLYALHPGSTTYLPMVNNDSIVAQAGGSVCNVTSANDTNNVTIYQSQFDGSLQNVDDYTRKISSVSTAVGISIAKSVSEYGDTTPAMPPIVVPLSTKTKSFDTLKVTDAALVYFDYPETYAQSVYVPMYLLSGTLSDGTKAYELYPAIDKADAAKLPTHSSSTNNQLQLEVYNPPLPKPSGTGACFGSQVDYRVTCNENTGSGVGVTVCSHYFEGYVGSRNKSSLSNDPFNICKGGNQTKTNPSFSAPAGTDVCKAFIDNVSNGQIDTSGTQPGAYPGVNYVGARGASTASYDGGTVTCTLSGNPC